MNKFGLIGFPLSHSFSKAYFTDKFARQKISASYENYELEKLGDLRGLMLSEKIKGFNVTIPYKKEVITQLDNLSIIAQKVGAVNTVNIVDGEFIGYNTDCYGFREMLKPLLKSSHERALILGTGGASQAVKFVLDSIGIETNIVSRQANNSVDLNYSELNEVYLASHKLIINTTPLGMFPDVNTSPDIPYEFISASHLAIDLIYNPEKTVFLKKTESQGAQIVNGTHMLIAQAEAAYKIWTEQGDDNFLNSNL